MLPNALEQVAGQHSQRAGELVYALQCDSRGVLVLHPTDGRDVQTGSFRKLGLRQPRVFAELSDSQKDGAHTTQLSLSDNPSPPRDTLPTPRRPTRRRLFAAGVWHHALPRSAQ